MDGDGGGPRVRWPSESTYCTGTIIRYEAEQMDGGGTDRSLAGNPPTAVGVNHRCTRTEQMDGDDGGGPTVRWPVNLPTAVGTTTGE
jgi:hypothetical protein